MEVFVHFITALLITALRICRDFLQQTCFVRAGKDGGAQQGLTSALQPQHYFPVDGLPMSCMGCELCHFIPLHFITALLVAALSVCRVLWVLLYLHL